MRQNAKWLGLLAAVVALFFWKILFTGQYSIIVGWEGVNQAYAWYNFAVRTIQQGVTPLWNPYTLSGHTYLGEPQTSLFYPFKLLLYLWPLGKSGVLSPKLFHQAYVLTHFLGACFLFLCAKELDIKNNFAAFIAAVCFTFGGFFGRLEWVNLADSSIWLPLIFLFLLRALRAQNGAARNLQACYAGLCMAMAILAGSLHVPLMDVLAVVSAAVFFAFEPVEAAAANRSLWSRVVWSGAAVIVIGVISFAASSLQLLPSAEYAPLARRWTGEWSGLFGTRIPYAVTGGLHHLGPRSIFAFLLGAADNGGGEFSPYFGIMPFILMVIGIWRNWGNPWVRYLAGLGLLAYFYSMGSYSFLHGLFYVLVPFMDKAWEAGRFLYLTHFCTALLAGFGVQTLLSEDERTRIPLTKFSRIVQWTVIVFVLALGVPVIVGKPDVNEWSFAALFFLIASWGVLVYVVRGNRTGFARFLLFAVIVCDLNAYEWTMSDVANEVKLRADYLDQMYSMREAADFLKSQPGLFRSHTEGNPIPTSVGDVFGIQSTDGWGATMLDDYLPVLWSPSGSCLFNVRYTIANPKDMPKDTKEKTVFTGVKWNVYEKPSFCPRAWMVDDILLESSHREVMQRVQAGGFDPLHVALMSDRPPIPLQGGAGESGIAFTRYQPDQFELTAHASRPGLLVLSEVFYPGWEAFVNQKPAHIYRVDGLLRGVIVPAGENQVQFRYNPGTVLAGKILTAASLLGTIGFALAMRRKRNEA